MKDKSEGSNLANFVVKMFFFDTVKRKEDAGKK